MTSLPRAAALIAVAALALSGCTSNAPAPGSPTASADARRLVVTASDTACELSSQQAPSGTLTFVVTNTGSQVTEFYLYAADGKRIIGEVEDIGPGLSRDLVVTATAGQYVTACKPGMAGEGIRGELTVTE